MTVTSCKIAYVIDDLAYGGAQRQLSLLVRALPDGYVPIVVSMSSNLHPFADAMREDGVRVVSLPRRTSNDVGRLWALRRTLKESGADLVHGFLDAANVYAYLSARTLRRPVMLSLRGDRLALSGVRAGVLAWTLRRADRVLVNSRAGRRLLLETINVNPSRVEYIPNWSRRDNGEPRPLPPESGDKVIGSIGRFVPLKRLHLLIEAFGEAHRRVPAARLVLMGSGPEKDSLLRRVEQLELGRWVEFLEPRLDVVGVLRRFYCFVLASGFEGLPNAVMEALAEGVPVIATPSGDVSDLIIDGKTGTLVNGDQPGALADAIVRVLSDTELLRNARTCGPELVRRKFSMSAALDRLLPVYDSLVGR